jgi:hypothetical protein
MSRSQHYLHSVADSVPRAPQYSDEDIARMIVSEHSRSALNHDDLYSFERESRPKDINKTFLEGTLRSVESHNRREVACLSQ